MNELTKNIEVLREKVKMVKHKCLQMCVNAGIGHITTGFSCAEIVVALYYAVMNYDTKNGDWKLRDRFIMSKNHGSVITYPILADIGFIEEKDLMTFMQDGSRLGGHSKNSLSGVDYSGGSLGIGLGVAAGLAYGAKLAKENWLTFAIVGDGECYEGSIWESVMFASHNKLNNLVIIVDRNEMACTDFTEHMLRLEPFREKWKSFGCDVIEIDGHSLESILRALEGIHTRNSEKPLCIIAKTVKGNGIDFMCNNPLMHGAAPKGESIGKAFEQLEKEIIR